MSNTYFTFKQFTVNQANSAAKVGADSVLLGACADIENAGTILDIGTGTGLLALMAAQRNPKAHIEAVEINNAAYLDAINNIKASPWQNRISVYNEDIAKYASNCKKQFDVIISNPPYFENSLKPVDAGRNIARHTDSLSFTGLMYNVRKLLMPKGIFVVILPVEQTNKLIKLSAGFNLYCIKQILIYPHKHKPANRIISTLTGVEKDLDIFELFIRNDDKHSYTYQYIELTADFYL